jgi:hypothetical protein
MNFFKDPIDYIILLSIPKSNVSNKVIFHIQRLRLL